MIKYFEYKDEDKMCNLLSRLLNKKFTMRLLKIWRVRAVWVHKDKAHLESLSMCGLLHHEFYTNAMIEMPNTMPRIPHEFANISIQWPVRTTFMETLKCFDPNCYKLARSKDLVHDCVGSVITLVDPLMDFIFQLLNEK
jgi:hypothetical protein